MQAKFHLQPLLSYKRNLEEVLEVELAQLTAAHAREQEELERLERSRQEVARQLRSFEAESQLNLELIKLTHGFLESLRVRIVAQSEVVAQLAGQVETKRRALIKAMQERKVLEKLKERHLAELQEQSDKQEMRVNDEIGVGLHHRTAREREATEAAAGAD
ncbi:MAG: flagellar export protein FliJ [Chloroflexota bacterium]